MVDSWVVLGYVPESYTSKDPCRLEGVQDTDVAGLLGSISVLTPSLSGLELAECWLWLLTPGSSNELNLGSNVEVCAGYEWSMG